MVNRNIAGFLAVIVSYEKIELSFIFIVMGWYILSILADGVW
jgi:hypothetical protein